jgi:hypothetical protein
MCVQCVMGAAAGFGIFQTYRFVFTGRARKWLGSRQKSYETEQAMQNLSPAVAAVEASISSVPEAHLLRHEQG